MPAVSACDIRTQRCKRKVDFCQVEYLNTALELTKDREAVAGAAKGRTCFYRRKNLL